MALTQLESPFRSFHGRNEVVGGQVCYSIADRNFARSFVIPDNPASAFQQSIRSFFTLASQAFSLLTNAERALWETLSVDLPLVDIFGQSYARTAKGAYVAVNVLRQLDAQAITDVAPASITQAAPTAITDLTFTAGTTNNFIFTHSNADGFFLLRASQTLPGLQRHARTNDYRLVSVAAINSLVARAASPQTVSIVGADRRQIYAAAARVSVAIQSLSVGYVPGQFITAELIVV
jgi:hypothetical protein